jgi:hypothetical protein
LRLQTREQSTGRGNPFDILSQRVGRFLATFLALWIGLTGLVAYSRIVTEAPAPLAWHETATICITAAAVTVAIAFPVSIALIEGIPMVFAHFIRQRHREEGLQEGLQEGLKEGDQRTQQLWEEWNQRRLEAQENGRAFDEPPPSLNSNNGTASKDTEGGSRD